MAYDITRLKADLEGIAHGTTLNQITNLNGLINRAARQVLMDVDPQETKRIVELSSPIFDGVYDYPLPVDLKGNKVIDIRPQVNRLLSDQFTQTYNEAFDVLKNKRTYPMFTMNFDSGLKSIRISQNLLQTTLINGADSTNTNGTWVAGGDASNLAVDNINFVYNTGSLKFDLSGVTGVGYLENSTMAPVDLSPGIEQNVQFQWSYLPDPSRFTSLVLRWGSSATDYWTNTVTETWVQTAFQTGWNQQGFPWEGATMVGTPDNSNINYLRITFNYSIGSPIFNVRVNDFTSSLGQIYEIEYYSKYMFRNAITGAFQETVLTNSDLINLDTETYNLLTNQCALLMVQQQQGADSVFDTQVFQKKYDDCLARYKLMYRSEIIKPKLNYYQKTSNNYRRWFGNGPFGSSASY